MAETSDLLRLCEWGLGALGGRLASRRLSGAWRDYTTELPTCPAPTLLDRNSWLESLCRDPVVCVGDFHPDPATKIGALDLLTRLGLTGRPLVVALETVDRRLQGLLDRYVDGRGEDADLRQALELGSWGAKWQHLQAFFHLARFAGWPLLALDDQQARGPDGRDRAMAGRLADSRRRRPEALHFAVTGESHLLPQHLPARLREHQIAPHCVFVNHLEAWRHSPLPEDGPQVFRLGPSESAWVCSTPLERSFHLPAEDLDGDEFLADLTVRMAEVQGWPSPTRDAIHWVFGPPDRADEYLVRRAEITAPLWSRIQDHLGGLVLARPASVVATRCDLATAGGLAMWSLSSAPKAGPHSPTPTELVWIGATVELGRQLLAPSGVPGSHERSRRGFWLGAIPLSEGRSVRHASEAMLHAGEQLGLQLWRERQDGAPRSSLQRFLTDRTVAHQRIARWRTERSVDR